MPITGYMKANFEIQLKISDKLKLMKKLIVVSKSVKPQVFSYVVHKKDAGSPSRTAPQPPVCSNLALHYTANN